MGVGVGDLAVNEILELFYYFNLLDQFVMLLLLTFVEKELYYICLRKKENLFLINILKIKLFIDVNRNTLRSYFKN